MGFGQINSDKGGLPSCSVWSFSTSAENPHEEIVLSWLCVNGTVCERNLSFEKGGICWGHDSQKYPQSKQRNPSTCLLEAIIFVEPSSLQIRNVEMLMATTLSHSVAKIFPQGGCIMKMAWTYGILWPRGTLNKIVECQCHPGTLIISGHLLDASSKTKWTRLKERQTNRDRKHHLEVQVPCLCAWIPKRLSPCIGGILYRSLVFFKTGFNFYKYILWSNIQKEPPFWVVDSSYGFMEEHKTPKRRRKKTGDPIVNREAPTVVIRRN